MLLRSYSVSAQRAGAPAEEGAFQRLKTTSTAEDSKRRNLERCSGYEWLICLFAPLLGCVAVVDSGEPAPLDPANGGASAVTPPISDARLLPPPGVMNATPRVLPVVGADIETIASSIEVQNKRRELIQFLWGQDGFPATKLPASVDRNVESPVDGLSNLERVDTIHIQMDAGYESMAHHFIPSKSKRNRLVIVHHGHGSSFNDDAGMDDAGYGMQRTINNLLMEGYSVLAMYMPGYVAGQAYMSHATIVETETTGSGMKFFLEPVAVCLNYLQTQAAADGFPTYQDFSMTGLSGGGWTTTVYAALDPRIKLSIPVAGSLPLSLRSGWSLGDEEQSYAPFYNIAGYTDLYVLGGFGAGRSQVQVLNRHDDCCFGESPVEYDPAQTGMSYDDAVRTYEIGVRNRLKNFKGGSFRVEIDEVATGHMISWNTIASIILAELDRGNAVIASTTDGFTRGDKGTLVHVSSAGIEDTAIPMVGVPAVVRDSSAAYEVFFRSPNNHLMHAFKTDSVWVAESLDAVAISDAVAVGSNSNRFDVVAIASDYLPHHWRGTEKALFSETIPGAPKTFGPPDLSARPDNRIEMSLRTWDHTTHYLFDDATGVWSMDPAMGEEAPVGADATAQ